MRQKRNTYRILVGNLKEKEHFEEPGIYGGYNQNRSEGKISFTSLRTGTSVRLLLT
jgi:hypothetical protein